MRMYSDVEIESKYRSIEYWLLHVSNHIIISLALDIRPLNFVIYPYAPKPKGER